MAVPRSPNLYRIPVSPPGRLSVMPRPRGHDQLNDEMAALRGAGVDVLVCLQPAAEREMAGLAEEPAAAVRAGMEFHVFPIVDFGVPDHAKVTPLLDTLTLRLKAGRHVVVHCYGGVGRSSLIAGALLVRLGTSAEQAWQIIAQARGCPVPETDAQRQWLSLYSSGDVAGTDRDDPSRSRRGPDRTANSPGET
jgi:protein-tyrosine phosphatase